MRDREKKTPSPSSFPLHPPPSSYLPPTWSMHVIPLMNTYSEASMVVIAKVPLPRQPSRPSFVPPGIVCVIVLVLIGSVLLLLFFCYDCASCEVSGHSTCCYYYCCFVFSAGLSCCLCSCSPSATHIYTYTYIHTHAMTHPPVKPCAIVKHIQVIYTLSIHLTSGQLLRLHIYGFGHVGFSCIP